MGCKKKEEDAKLIFEKTEYELMVGDIYALQSTSQGKINHIEYDVEKDDVISCNENGKILRLKEGTSELYVVINEDPNTKTTLKITVITNPKPIIVGNAAENEKLYNNLLSEISIFISKLEKVIIFHIQ